MILFSHVMIFKVHHLNQCTSKAILFLSEKKNKNAFTRPEMKSRPFIINQTYAETCG